MTHDGDLSRAALPALLTASDAVAAGGARFQRGPTRCMISRVSAVEVATGTPVLGGAWPFRIVRLRLPLCDTRTARRPARAARRSLRPSRSARTPPDKL